MNLGNPYHYLVITAIAGILVLVAHWLVKKIIKSRGKIRCHLAYCRVEFIKEIDEWGEVKKFNYDKAKLGEYCFEIDLFNEKDMQVAIRNPKITFGKMNKLKKKISLPIIKKGKNEEITRINLPPRELLHCGGGKSRIHCRNDLEIVVMSNKINFEGQLPNGKNIRVSLLTEPFYNFLDKDFRDVIEITR
jgi:hypothetical protein